MDRLLCGDVGYGKTEVAVRAAFKVASSGKQVAVLVPTTILAEQHYTTFRERFADFPLEVGILSRFRTPAENKETVRRLSQGLLDVVVGTHRLLQKDVKFFDLGLLIIDEEQRFGVAIRNA
ncbi:MAG: DEAD/DEAH box helicase [Firmicutes bacterium]|nr:DEAD/DEAH box helicase [Bacillota bacterium]